jgi:hypothetical protein
MKEKATKESHLALQREICLTILDFFLTLKDAYQPHYLTMMKGSIHNVYKAGHLQSLKMGVKELIKMARDLKEEQIKELDLILYQKFRITVESYDKAKIEKIIKKGKIDHQDEYKMMFDHFEQIHQLSDADEYISLISSLLEDYQIRTGKV